jgi:hypothetical protein
MAVTRSLSLHLLPCCCWTRRQIESRCTEMSIIVASYAEIAKSSMIGPDTVDTQRASAHKRGHHTAAPMELLRANVRHASVRASTDRCGSLQQGSQMPQAGYVVWQRPGHTAEPRRKHEHRCPTTTAPAVIELVLRMRAPAPTHAAACRRLLLSDTWSASLAP